jgi:hypothetical protein
MYLQSQCVRLLPDVGETARHDACERWLHTHIHIDVHCQHICMHAAPSEHPCMLRLTHTHPASLVQVAWFACAQGMGQCSS